MSVQTQTSPGPQERLGWRKLFTGQVQVRKKKFASIDSTTFYSYKFFGKLSVPPTSNQTLMDNNWVWLYTKGWRLSLHPTMFLQDTCVGMAVDNTTCNKPIYNQVHPLINNNTMWIWKLTAIRQKFYFLDHLPTSPTSVAKVYSFAATDCSVQTHNKWSILILKGNRKMFPRHSELSQQVYHIADLKLAVKELIKFETWFNRKLVNDSSAPIIHKTGDWGGRTVSHMQNIEQRNNKQPTNREMDKHDL